MFLMEMSLPYFGRYLNKKELDNTTDTKGTGLNIFHIRKLKCSVDMWLHSLPT